MTSHCLDADAGLELPYLERCVVRGGDDPVPGLVHLDTADSVGVTHHGHPAGNAGPVDRD